MSRRSRSPHAGREPQETQTTAAGTAAPLVALLLLAPLLAACDSLPFATSDWQVRVGVLAGDVRDQPIQVPSSVVVGEAFTASVLTRGGGCDAKAQTVVERGSTEATIAPRDSIFVGSGACPAVLRTFRHEASLSFEETGTATVRFRVRESEGGSVVVIGRSVEVTADGG